MQRNMNRNKWVWPLGLALAGLAVWIVLSVLAVERADRALRVLPHAD